MPLSAPKLNAIRLRLHAVLGAFLFCAGSLGAQQADQTDAAPVTRLAPLRARIRSGDIQVDGVIDEAAWEGADVATGFVQAEPIEQAKATEDTEVRLLIDDEAIYVSARMWDSHPEQIVRQLLRRDERGPFFDWFGISIDPNHDRRTAYSFDVSAAGVQQDRYVFDDQFEDVTWNAVWESAVSIDSLGWSVEYRIPLSQIRYAPVDGPRTWGIQYTRRRAASAEMTNYVFMSRRKEEGITSRYATLENVILPASVRRVEARPYILSGYHNGPAEPGDPFFDGSATENRIGSDFRLGLGSGFTLDATVNPDFGQVDADPAQINLTAFETFNGERRPFFVEDAQLFDFNLSGGQNQLFYSRRIGRAPHASAPGDADFSDIPDAATILGAAKLTGRTAGGLAMGALTAVTGAETGRAFFLNDGQTVDFAAEPHTEYGVLSAQQDLKGGASQLGAIFTALHRDLGADGIFDFLPDQAYNGGVRFEHQWNDRGWRLNGFFAASHVRGTPDALIRLQRASNHYFQRPDAPSLEVDSAATTFTGASWRLQLDRQNTRHWTGSIWTSEITPGFEINDLGFSSARERFEGGARFGYREVRPGTHFREYNFNFMTFYNFSHDGLDGPFGWDTWRRAYTGGNFNLSARATLLNFNSADLSFGWQPDTYSRVATRGGPIMIEPGSVNLRAGFSSDRRSALSVNLGVHASKGSLDSGHDYSVDGSLNYRPNSQLVLQLQPRYSIQTDRGQYVTSTSAVSYEPTFGRRYLFGDLERKTFSLETRADYTFSPTLTLQVFAQPLISSGDYVRYKQLVTPATYDFQALDPTLVGRDQQVDFDGNGSTDYTFTDKDFNVGSLIGSAVLRWEYRPGSTIFLVWQRQQQGDGTLGNFDFNRDVDALWSAPADNRFMLKVNYWLGL